MDKTATHPIEFKTKDFVGFERSELETSIVDHFEKQVRSYPNHLAVKDRGTTLTYSELNMLANKLAHLILNVTGEYCGPISFLLEHGAFQIVAIFGILKSGNGYIALDPDFPQARLEFMVKDSESPLLITNRKNLDFAEEISPPGVQLINLDDIDKDTPCNNPELDISADTMAMVQYTSGSTGQPKGCVLQHKSIMHHIMVMTNRRYINPRDRLLFMFSASFGASTGPIFNSLLKGASLYPYDVKARGLGNLVDFLTEEKITIFSTVPSTFRYFVTLLEPGNNFPDVRMITTGGDTVLRNDIDLFKDYFSEKCCFDITYAGTEFLTTRSAVLTKEDQLSGAIVPVGYPVDDKTVFLLNDAGDEVPAGEVGEIVIQSEFIARKYWRRPELTKEKFEILPGQAGVIQYRTGDLGRMDPDGCLYHLGRKDRQVKIRGHRVELAEITSILLDSPLVEDAFVKAHTNIAGESLVIAYIVSKVQSETLVRDVLAEISEHLPAYMIPAEFMVLDEIPKNPAGKVDALALPEPERTRASLRTAYVEPRDEVERKLVGIWEKLLNFQPIGIEDDFFELGGHSLLALRLIAEIEDAFKESVPFPALVQVRTITELATLLQDKAGLKSWSNLVPLQPLGSKPPLFIVPPSAVTVMLFKDLAKHFDQDRPLYALEYNGMDPESEPHDSIPDMAKHNIEKIKAMQPEGPYYLGGMCFGGLVAYEMAKQLLDAGEQVPFLGVLDSTHAPYLSRPRSYPVFMFTRFLNQKVLGKRFPIGMAPLKRAMQRFAPEDEFSHRVYDVFTTHNYARVKYVTTPYTGDITLFNTAGSRGEFSRDQWKAVAGGSLEIVSIPGVHAGARVDIREGQQSFIHEPMVEVLTKKLNSHLDQA
jgi:amino acid adenylation domain-containing protein